MRTFPAVIVSVLALSGAGPVSPQTAANVPRQDAKVVFQFEEAKLPDEQRAKLATILARDLPEREWPTIVVRKGDSIEKIIDRYFDVYAGGNRKDFSVPLPETTRTLAQLILSANQLDALPLREGQVLRIPSLPARGKSGAGVDEGFRTYSIDDQAYTRWAKDGPLTASAPDFVKPAREMPEWRNSRFTMVAASAAAAPELAALDGEVSALHVVDMELLGAQACPPAADSLRASPYFQRALDRLTAESGRIQRETANDRIRLIDFDFTSGHGRDVTGAAKWLLREFGLAALDDRLEPIELNPVANKTALTTILSDYFAIAPELGVTLPEMGAASVWVLRERPSVGNAVVSVPPVLLQAAIWDGLQKRRWMSWSWRIVSPGGVLPGRFGASLQASGAFITVAAGNEVAAVRADLMPQGASSIFREVSNVTYGSAAGDLLGSREDRNGGGRVDLLAAGCGFPAALVSAGLRGSSLASPMVITAAWLKHWLDKIPASQMRQTLATAALLVPKAAGHTGSAGVFDPARLMLKPFPHYLNAARTAVVPITGAASLTTNCGVFALDPSKPGSQDFVIYQAGAGHHLLRRQAITAFPFITTLDPCPVTSLDFVAVTGTGPLSITSASAFAAQIGHLTF